MKTSGTDIDQIMPPISRFGGGGRREEKKQAIIDKLKAFFDKYLGLGLKAMDDDRKTGGNMTSIKKHNPGEYNKDDFDALMVAEKSAPYSKKE